MTQHVELEIGGQRLLLETGRMAKLADGAVLARCGDTVVLGTAVSSKVARTGVDFLPLTCDYQEKAYAVGRIPGGYFRREGRPTEREILSSRLIDRPLRPLFPKGYYFDIQVVASVLSADQGNTSDLLGIIAASAALAISDIPLLHPIAAVRIGRLNGQFIVNPSFADTEAADLNLIVAGTEDAVMMVEGGSAGLPEQTIIEAILLAHSEIKKIVQAIERLRQAVGKPKRPVPAKKVDAALQEAVRSRCQSQIEAAVLIPNKADRKEKLNAIHQEAAQASSTPEANRATEVAEIFHEMERKAV
ncbi:MAG TPA: polyribonucleotide nucleotidyltransferase, partial [Nitrospiria bacterium]